MACNQTLTGIAYDCTPSMGGVRRVLLINWAEVTGVTLTQNVVSAITKETGKAFKEYRFRPNTAYANAERQVSAENGTNYVNESLYMQFSKQDTAKRLEMEAIGRTETMGVVEDANGKFFLYGKDFPLAATAGTAPTGTAAADFNGYSVTLGAQSAELPYEVDATIIAGLLVAATAGE